MSELLDNDIDRLVGVPFELGYLKQELKKGKTNPKARAKATKDVVDHVKARRDVKRLVKSKHDVSKEGYHKVK